MDAGFPECCLCESRHGRSSQACCNGHAICNDCFHVICLGQVEGSTRRCPRPDCNEKIKTSSGATGATSSTGSTIAQPSTTPSPSQTPEPSGSGVSHENAATVTAPKSPKQGGSLQKVLASQRALQQAQQSAKVHSMLQSFGQALSERLQKIKEEEGTIDRQSKSTRRELENVQKLATYFDKVSRQGEVDERLWQRELERAIECDGKLADVQRGLSMLNLESGSLRVDLRAARVNGGPESSFTTSLDLTAEASRRPDVLAATKYLLFLLNKEDEPEIQEAEGGVLDLAESGLGSAKQGEREVEKTKLLNSTMSVTSLTGLDCSMDPRFCSRLIKKHANSLESLALRKVQQEQFSLLRDLPLLKHLDLRNCEGRLSAARLPTKAQPGRGEVLCSLYASLPFKIQAELWEAFAASLVNVTLRVEVQSNLDVHRTIGPLAARTPNLRTIHLTRKKQKEHTEDGCARQTADIRKEVANDIRVSCNVCGVEKSGV